MHESKKETTGASVRLNAFVRGSLCGMPHFDFFRITTPRQFELQHYSTTGRIELIHLLAVLRCHIILALIAGLFKRNIYHSKCAVANLPLAAARNRFCNFPFPD